MGRRRKPRFRMVLPVSIWGSDAGGKAFHQLAYTVDISTGGAKLAGIQAELKPGEIIAVRYKQRKARFHVVWSANHEAGIQYVEGEHFIWIELPEEEFVDREPVRESRPAEAVPPAPASSAPSPATSEASPAAAQDAAASVEARRVAPPARNDELASTLEACLASLRSLDELVNTAGMTAQIAQQFHAATGHLRNTAWAVQQWIELQAESRETGAIAESVNSERVRFGVQLCRELAEDEQRLMTGVSRENREALRAAVQQIAQRLGVVLEPRSSPAGENLEAVRRDPVALLAGLNQEMRSAALSAEGTLDLLADRARSFTDADGAAIALRDQEDMVCCASSGMAPLPGIRFSASGGLAGDAIAARKCLCWRDSEKDNRVDAALCRSLNLRSSAVTPIISGDGVLGVLQVFSAQPNAFDEATLPLLQHLAEFVASMGPSLLLESEPR